MATKKKNPAVAKRIADRKAFVKDKVASKGLDKKEARKRFYVQTRVSEMKAKGKTVTPEMRKKLREKFESGNLSRKGFGAPKRKGGSKKTPAIIPMGPDKKGSVRATGLVTVPVKPVKPGRQRDGRGVLISAEQRAKEKAAARNPKVGRQSDGRGVLMSAEQRAKEKAAKRNSKVYPKSLGR
jgi:hypothetical protein